MGVLNSYCNLSYAGAICERLLSSADIAGTVDTADTADTAKTWLTLSGLPADVLITLALR